MIEDKLALEWLRVLPTEGIGRLKSADTWLRTWPAALNIWTTSFRPFEMGAPSLVSLYESGPATLMLLLPSCSLKQIQIGSTVVLQFKVSNVRFNFNFEIRIDHWCVINQVLLFLLGWGDLYSLNRILIHLRLIMQSL